MVEPTTSEEPATAVEPATRTDDPVPRALTDSSPSSRRRRSRIAAIGGLLVVAIIAVAAWQAGRPTAVSPSAPRSGTGLAPLIAMVDTAGALVTVDLAGRRTPLAAGPGITTGFPAWSPDGRRVAAIRAGDGDPAIAIFAVRRDEPVASPAPAAAPVVVYRSAEVPPFYLYWTPDGQRVSFLATEADVVSLRIAPADGSAPLDGSGPGALIKRGAPLYFDWIGTDRVLLHVGAGVDAYLGEVGLDGSAVAPGLPGAGDFRSAVVGADGRFMAFVRGQNPAANLVVAARDGSAEHLLPVFGPAAALFDPRGVSVAAIAAAQASDVDLGFPFGPLRLIEAGTGATRTLLEGTVIGFFWSPDGRTIAALRIQAGSGSTTAARPIVAAAALTAADDPAAAASPAPTPQPGPELHLLFLDVADGAIRSDRVVRLTQSFVNQFLPFFDQYALSHRVWSPDSSSLLLPLVDAAGRDQLVILPSDGAVEPTTLEGQSGFWSP